MSEAKRRQSPYVRYAKAPYQYSELYQKWKAAVMSGDEAGARKWGTLHTQRFGSRERLVFFGKAA